MKTRILLQLSTTHHLSISISFSQTLFPCYSIDNTNNKCPLILSLGSSIRRCSSIHLLPHLINWIFKFNTLFAIVACLWVEYNIQFFLIRRATMASWFSSDSRTKKHSKLFLEPENHQWLRTLPFPDFSLSDILFWVPIFFSIVGISGGRANFLLLLYFHVVCFHYYSQCKPSLLHRIMPLFIPSLKTFSCFIRRLLIYLKKCYILLN